MRLGLLTGGGDCPGLNATIRAVVCDAERHHGDTVVAFRHGWRGVVHDEASEMTSAMARGIIGRGGTIIGTARFHPHEHEGGLDAVAATAKRNALDAFVVVGGDGTLDAAAHVAETGIPLVGIPKTIDNDVAGTDACIGFDTALATAAEAIDRLHTTAESHDRTMVIELMGRESGWLTVCAGLAGGADAILVPELPLSIGQLVDAIGRRHRGGSSYSIVAVAEGVDPPPHRRFDTRSVGPLLAAALAAATGYETRATVLGHVQRGGPPTARDRLLGTRFGVAAVRAVHEGAVADMVAFDGDEVTTVGLERIAGRIRPVPDSLLDTVRRLTLA